MASMTMPGDEVVIRFAQAEEAFQAAAAKQEMQCLAAERKCRMHIASHPTSDFV